MLFTEFTFSLHENMVENSIVGHRKNNINPREIIWGPHEPLSLGKEKLLVIHFLKINILFQENSRAIFLFLLFIVSTFFIFLHLFVIYFL